MKRNRSLSACPTAQESVAGGVYFIFQLVLLPPFSGGSTPSFPSR